MGECGLMSTDVEKDAQSFSEVILALDSYSLTLCYTVVSTGKKYRLSNLAVCIQCVSFIEM
jgi:hypothetical protein